MGLNQILCGQISNSYPFRVDVYCIQKANITTIVFKLCTSDKPTHTHKHTDSEAYHHQFLLKRLFLLGLHVEAIFL